MNAFLKPYTKLAFVLVSTLIIGTTLFFTMGNNSKDIQKQNDKTQIDKKSNNEIPKIQGAYYKGIITITEKDVFEAKAQVTSSGIIDSTYKSEEILFFDPKTDKCYILGRRLSFDSSGSITVNHSKGAFSGLGDLDSSGKISEFYGDKIIMYDDKVDANYSKLPVRIDVKKQTIYTNVPSKRNDWVVTLAGGEKSLGPATVFLPETFVNVDFGLIPGISNIDGAKTYSSKDSILDDLSNRLVTPSGNFKYNYKKMTFEEIMADLGEFKREQEEGDSKSKEEYIPELPPLPSDDRDTKVDTKEHIPIPGDYPLNLVPIIEGANVAISETTPSEVQGKKVYNLTLKSNESVENAVKFYKDAFKKVSNVSMFSSGGISTISGNKANNELSIMILNNTLGGNEKTMIQIVITPTK